MFFDNFTAGNYVSQVWQADQETVRWFKAENRKCPFCDMLFETTEFRRGIDEATNRTHEMLQKLQDSLGSIKIKIKL
jgi:hypothetical protein